MGYCHNWMRHHHCCRPHEMPMGLALLGSAVFASAVMFAAIYKLAIKKMYVKKNKDA